jgi:hypothetical protein
VKNRIRLATWLAPALCCSALLAGSAETGPPPAAPPPPDPEAAFQRTFDWIAREIELTEEQRPKVEPILREHYEALRAARDEARASGGEGRDLFRSRHAELARKTEKRLAAVLDDEQLASYRELREEVRQRGRRHGRGPRGTPPI